MTATKSSINNNLFYKYGYQIYKDTFRPSIIAKECFRKYINKNLAIEIDLETTEVRAFKNKRTYYGRQWTQLKKVKTKWINDVKHLFVMDAVFNEK